MIEDASVQERQALTAALHTPTQLRRETLSDAEGLALAAAVTAWRDRNNAAFDAFGAARRDSDASLRADVIAVSPTRNDDGWVLDPGAGMWVQTIEDPAE